MNGLYNISDPKININEWKKLLKDDTYIKEIIKKCNDILINNFKFEGEFFIMGTFIKNYLFGCGDKQYIALDIFIYMLENNKFNKINFNKFINKIILNKNKNKNKNFENTFCVKMSKEYNIYIMNKLYKSVSNGVASNKYCDRICLYKNNIYVSKMFVNEYIKYINDYQNNNNDPYLKLPKDTLNIYNKNLYGKNPIKRAIDMANINNVKYIINNCNFYNNEIINIYLKYKQYKQKLTLIEYSIIKYVNECQSIVKHNLQCIIIILSKYNYIRHPVYIAKYFKLNLYEPELFKYLDYKLINHNNHNHDHNNDFDKFIKNINYEIIQNMVINDDILVINFIKYINKKNKNKKIYQLCCKFKAVKIIEIIMKSTYILDTHKAYIIVMTGKISNKIYIKNENLFFDYLHDILENGIIRSLYYLIKINNKYITDYRDNNNNNILHLLTNKGDPTDIIKIVLKLCDGLQNIKNNKGITPIFLYIKKGYDDNIKTLLDSKTIDINLVDNNKNNIIHYLCKYGKTDILDIYIRKLNIENIINNKNIKEQTPIIVASKYGWERIFYILKGLKCNLLEKDKYHNTVYHYICYNCICVGLNIPNGLKNLYGYTPYDYSRISKEYYNYL